MSDVEPCPCGCDCYYCDGYHNAGVDVCCFGHASYCATRETERRLAAWREGGPFYPSDAPLT